MNRFRTVMLFVPLVVFPLLFSGCNQEGIWVSRSELNFERDTNPQFFSVANINPELGTINVIIEANRSWIRVAPTVVPCKPPTQAGRVEETVEVRIDRSRITSTGRNEGTITLSARGVKPVTIKVTAIQDSLNPPLAPLNIVNPVTTFSTPYLVEFAFSLRDQNDRAITGEPAQFTLTAFEDETPVGRPQGLLMRRGAARQLWIEIVMDYSVFMREIPDAVAEMERAAIEVLLPSLNEDALVAVSGFYRDNQDSRLIVPYTVDRQHVSKRIREIRSTDLTGFASGARVHDALISAITRFDELSTDEKDDKYIVLLCNGRDTSSTASSQQVVNAAKARGVRIIAVGFGDSIDSGPLMTLALAANGRFISASALDDLQTSFGRIVEDLSGQYVVRWASARRDAVEVRPSFKLALGTKSATHVSPQRFRARNHAGDPLKGELILIQSETPGNTTVFLRANYVPYDISKFQFRVSSAHAFTTALVGPADDGLLAGWTLNVANESSGTKLITVESKGAPIPFAAFGAMLRFNFNQAVDTAFTQFDILDAFYGDGQTFVLR